MGKNGIEPENLAKSGPHVKPLSELTCHPEMGSTLDLIRRDAKPLEDLKHRPARFGLRPLHETRRLSH